MRHTSDHGSMLGRTGGLIALAGLIGVAWRCVASTHARERTARAEALPEPLQVWEDEGGQNQMLDEAAPARSPVAGPDGARDAGMH